MKKLSFRSVAGNLLFPVLVCTGLTVTSCAREEEKFCSEPQVEPGTEKIIGGSCDTAAKINKTTSKKEI